MLLLADVHGHLEGEGHLPLLGGGRAVGAVALQVGDIRKPYSRNLGCIYWFSLYPFSPVRRVAIHILVHPLFSLIIITTILLNCFMMIMPSSEQIESSE